VALGLLSAENALMRGIAIGWFFAAVSIWLGYLILKPSFSFVTSNTKFRGDRGRQVRIGVECALRIGFLALAVFLASQFIKYCYDVYDFIHGRSPKTLRCEVLAERSNGLTWWGWKTLSVKGVDGTIHDYSLIFHPARVRSGGVYEIILFPNSKCVLAVRPAVSRMSGDGNLGSY